MTVKLYYWGFRIIPIVVTVFLLMNACEDPFPGGGSGGN